MSRVLRLTRGRTTPAISLSADDATITVADGGSSVAINLTLSRANFTGSVSLAVSGLPSGVTGSFSDSTLTGAETSSVLTISASGALAVTDDAFTITASASGVSDSVVNGTVTVTASYTPFLTEDWSSYANIAAAQAVHVNRARDDLMSLDSTNTYAGIQTVRYSFPEGTEYALYKTFNAATAVDPTNDWITITAHGFTTGRKVRYRAGGGTVIGGLTDDTIYYAIADTKDRLRLATSSANALANTYIDLTSTGSGSSQGIHGTIAADGLGTGHPMMERNFGSNKTNVWAKFKMRWEPGFTTNGSMAQVLGDYYASSASSYKHWAAGFGNANGRVLQAITNGTEYQGEIVISSWIPNDRTPTSASATQGSGFNVANEHTDGLWYTYYGHFWQNSSTQMTYKIWRGPDVGAPTLIDTIVLTLSGDQFSPYWNRFALGQNYNKYRDPGNTLALNWGPYELVDGTVYADPYGLGAT